MKVLIADKFEAFGIDQLRALPADVFNEPGLKGDALAARLRELDPDVLIVRSTKVPAPIVNAGPRLKMILRAGAGVDNIDVAAASQRGVMVTNCPGQNAVAVAELTIGLMVSLDRRIPDNVADFRAHKWNKKEYSKALGLKGRALGIIGAGRIGTEVARRALAMDMQVLFYHLGRNLRLADYANCRRAELDDLLRDSDVVTIHVPGGEATRRLIDERRIGFMRPNALLINTSRPDVLDEEALRAALRGKRIRAAALDVFENEPPADAERVDSPACDIPNLYVTHHIGASTEQAQLAIASETVRIVAAYKNSGKALNCINLQPSPQRSVMLVVRFVNKPGGLAHVFQCIAQEDINVEEMEHVIYDGGKAACAHIRVSHAPSEAVVSRIRAERERIMGLELIQID
ncbi:MAG: phosphoglycerate dehydrogenase [Phycisphaerae bacterium]